MEKHHSCLNTRAIIQYFQDHYPTEVPRLLEGLGPEIAALPNPFDFLMEINNWVSSDVIMQMFANARLISGDEAIAYKIGFESSARRKFSYVQRVLLFAFKNPRRSLRRAQAINDKFNRNKRLELVSTTRNTAVIRLHWFPEIPGHKDFCLYNQGIYAAIPVIWNLPTGLVEETSCYFSGDEYCEFHLTWIRKFSWREALRRLLLPWRALKFSIAELEQDKELLKQKFDEVHRLNLQLQEKINQLICLQEASTAALSIRDQETLLRAILKTFQKFARLDQVAVLRLEEAGSDLVFLQGEGLSPDLGNRLRKFHLPLSAANPLAQAARTGQPVVFPPSPRGESGFANGTLPGFSDHHCIAAPLSARGQLTGILLAAHRRPAGYQPADVNFTVNFANQLALVLDNLNLYRRLELSERKHRELIENAHEGIWIVDDQARVQYANRRLSQITGWRELDGQNLFTLFPAESQPLMRQVWRQNRRGKVAQEEIIIPSMERGPVTTLMSSVPLLDGERFLGAFAMFSDISEVKAMEQQLHQAQKLEAIGTLASGIAHDFNNILMAITGYTEESLREVRIDGPVYQKLQQVMQAAQRAADLVKQILTFSRKGEQQRQLVHLSPLIDDSLKMLRATLPSTIAIRSQLRAADDMVLADPTQIHQVLINLGTNAAHAMREKGGLLEITLQEVSLDPDAAGRYENLTSGPYLQLRVRDTGHGMDQTLLARIFDPFFTTKKPGEGTGMGLAVVHGIIKAHSGDLTVSSQPGVGTVFQILLPKAAQPADLADVIPTPRPAVSHGHEKILLVDDEPTLVDLGSRLLTRLGYSVVPRSTSPAALATFRAAPETFDLVITDHTMPAMTGLELARQLVIIRPDIPIILFTGIIEEIPLNTVSSWGIRKVLSKPMVLADLARAVRDVLDNQTALPQD